MILCPEYFGSVGGSEADLGNKPTKATCPLSLTPPPLCLAQQNTIYARHKRILFHPLPHTHKHMLRHTHTQTKTKTKTHTPSHACGLRSVCLLLMSVSPGTPQLVPEGLMLVPLYVIFRSSPTVNFTFIFNKFHHMKINTQTHGHIQIHRQTQNIAVSSPPNSHGLSGTLD